MNRLFDGDRHPRLSRPDGGPGRERGAALVVVSVSLVALMAFVALVIDLGDSRQRARENQSVADHSSVAAAAALSSDPADRAAREAAHAAARDFVGRNLGAVAVRASCGGDAAGMRCYTVGEARVEITTPYPGSGSPAHEAVHIRVCSRSPGFFGPALGLVPGEVCRDATAVLEESVLVVPAVLALDRGASHAIDLSGSGRVLAEGGSVVANSVASTALRLTDRSSLTVTGPVACACAVGGTSVSGSARVTPVAVGGIAPIADPWADLVEPSVTRAGSYDPTTRTFSPGRFGDITIDRAGTYTFLPGIYRFDGLFRIAGTDVHVVAEEVLFHVGRGRLDWGSGVSTVRISARPPDEYYGGAGGAFPPVAIFQSRTNTASFEFGDDVRAGVVDASSCRVDATAGISGGVYLPGAVLNVRGNTGSGLCTDGAPVVARQIHVRETGSLRGTTAAGQVGTVTRSVRLVE